jgi:hypothetical protein
MKIFELFESESGIVLTPQLLTATIEQTIKEYKKKYRGKIKTARDIGNGYCYEFTRDVFEKLGQDINENGLLQECRSEDYEKDDFVASTKLLKAAGEIIPKDIPRKAFESLIGEATHSWIKFNGMYYDASAPHGVRHFLEMPFFADQIAWLRNELSGTSPASTYDTKS